MAIFHLATITPTKLELIAEWAPTRPWGPPASVPIESVGSYRFDDPDGRVGMEVLAMFRRLAPRPRPRIGLTATWQGRDDAVVLADVRERFTTEGT